MMDKNSLLASLTNDQPVENEVGRDSEGADQDLFGDIAIEREPSTIPATAATEQCVGTITAQIPDHLQAVHTPAMIPVVPSSTPPVHQTTPVDSLLSKSGLLGESTTGETNGGSLFDEIDVDQHGEVNDAQNHGMNNNNTAQMKHDDQILRMQKQSFNSPHPAEEPVQVNPDTAAPNEQQSAIMQSAIMTQGHLNSEINALNLNNSGFYREHGAPVGQNTNGIMTATLNEYGRPTSQNNGNYFYGTRDQPVQNTSLMQQQHQQQPQFSNFVQPSSTVGMHNSNQNINSGRIRKITLVKPPDVAPVYVDIRVTEPMLIQTQSFLISSSPYWSYQITSHLAENQGTWLVRRRFRHAVALEDRLRQACPGCIIPPRPDKHASRALEEASTQQSAEFAVQRANELELYLNQVAQHPVAGQSQVFRLFLGLQDDIGTAWPEVSANAFTRLGAVGAGVSMKVAESTTLTAASSPANEWEEDAELLGLCSSETLRIGAVSQAVPKLEGTVIVLREQGDAAGILGMELSKASKTLDSDYKLFDTLSSGLLRHGRRTKRLALEMSAAMDSFLQQYKLVRYEKMAMQDRRLAIQRRAKERGRADPRAIHMSQQQRSLQVNGHMHHLSQGEQNTISMDGNALNTISEADEIGTRLKLEINRVAIDRRITWNNSIKKIASSMQAACNERVAIWESTLEAFEAQVKQE